MMAVSICQEMKWTYLDYLQQPNWFIELLKSKLIIDNRKIQESEKKLK